MIAVQGNSYPGSSSDRRLRSPEQEDGSKDGAHSCVMKHFQKPVIQHITVGATSTFGNIECHTFLMGIAKDMVDSTEQVDKIVINIKNGHEVCSGYDNALNAILEYKPEVITVHVSSKWIRMGKVEKAKAMVADAANANIRAFGAYITERAAEYVAKSTS